MSVVLRVVGVPAPQGSKTRYGNRMVEGSSASGRAALAEWRRAVADAAREALAGGAQRFTGPVSLRLTFTFTSPKSDPYRTRHTTKPDLDKIVRATSDALVHSTMLADDSLVFELFADKRYTPVPGCEITIEDATQIEAEDRDWLKDVAKAARKRAKGAGS